MDQRRGRTTVGRSPLVGNAVDPAERLRRALSDCPTLVQRSPERDALWLEVRAAICTREAVEVAPYGSAAHVQVTQDEATTELIVAMVWLYEHESHARSLDAQLLLYTLRSVATRSGTGSARSAQADSLHGMTAVPAGIGVQWWPVDGGGVA